MHEKYSVNIDEISDLYLAESLVNRGECENFPASILQTKKLLLKKD